MGRSPDPGTLPFKAIVEDALLLALGYARSVAGTGRPGYRAGKDKSWPTCV